MSARKWLKETRLWLPSGIAWKGAPDKGAVISLQVFDNIIWTGQYSREWGHTSWGKLNYCISECLNLRMQHLHATLTQSIWWCQQLLLTPWSIASIFIRSFLANCAQNKTIMAKTTLSSTLGDGSTDALGSWVQMGHWPNPWMASVLQESVQTTYRKCGNIQLFHCH